MSNEQTKLEILSTIAQSLENISSVLADIQFSGALSEPIHGETCSFEADAEPEYPETISELPGGLLDFLNNIRASEESEQDSRLSALESMMGLGGTQPQGQDQGTPNEKEAFEAGILDGIEAAIQKLLGPGVKIRRIQL